MNNQAPITRDEVIWFYLHRFLTPFGTAALEASGEQSQPVLLHRAYYNDIASGRCDALWWACEFGVLPAVERSLEYGAPVNQYLQPTHPEAGNTDWRNWPAYELYMGQTPLTNATRTMNAEVVRALLENGADPNMPYRRYEGDFSTPLELLMLIYMPNSSETDYLDTMRVLLNYGADPNLVFRRTFPAALKISLLRRDMGPVVPVEATRLLLEHGAVALRPNSQHPSDYPWLKELFLFINRVGPPDDTTVEKIDLILQYHAGSLHPDAWEIPLYLTLSTPRRDTRRLLEVALRHGCDPNALCYNFWRKHKDSPLKVMINSLLHTRDAACFYRNTAHGLAMLEMLLLAGADPDLRNQPRPRIVRDGEWAGTCTALAFLAWNGREARYDRDLCNSIMLLLLQHGASPDIHWSADGVTPLHLECRPGAPDKQRVEWLLEYGADVNAKTIDGKTALQFLCPDHGWPTPREVDVIDVLVRHGAVTGGRDFGMPGTHGKGRRGGTIKKIMRSYSKTSDYCRWKTHSVMSHVKGWVKEIRIEN